MQHYPKTPTDKARNSVPIANVRPGCDLTTRWQANERELNRLYSLSPKTRSVLFDSAGPSECNPEA
jgi:hypothetical protein